MGKAKLISELTNLLAIALRHRIGSIVNKEEIYVQKYAKDALILINEAKKLAIQKNWNFQDKHEIKKQLKLKLQKELEEKTFINNKKFELMDNEIEKVLKEISLN